jgi:hypothetical protein
MTGSQSRTAQKRRETGQAQAFGAGRSEHSVLDRDGASEAGAA